MTRLNPYAQKRQARNSLWAASAAVVVLAAGSVLFTDIPTGSTAGHHRGSGAHSPTLKSY